MKEIIFINNNATRWTKFESVLNDMMKKDPDEMADLFIQITDDLSYARTYYPDKQVTHYLNSLALRAHQDIYKNKRQRFDRLITFWTTEVPMVMNDTRKQLLSSFIIFAVATLVGIVSTLNDEGFARMFLGDNYIDLTLENIEKGEPMGIYAQTNEADMFSVITINNIRVSFIAFILGLFFSVGTAILLINNGVMLGTFFTFLYQHDVLYDAMTVVWLHGTLEISSIIIAGAAGITLGNSFMFPGTYSRVKSLIRGAKQGVKLIIGLLPVFITAGFIEGFVTRYANMSELIKFNIIIGSLAFVIWYFIIHPIVVGRSVTGVIKA